MRPLAVANFYCPRLWTAKTLSDIHAYAVDSSLWWHSLSQIQLEHSRINSVPFVVGRFLFAYMRPLVVGNLRKSFAPTCSPSHPRLCWNLFWLLPSFCKLCNILWSGEIDMFGFSSFFWIAYWNRPVSDYTYWITTFQLVEYLMTQVWKLVAYNLP